MLPVNQCGRDNRFQSRVRFVLELWVKGLNCIYLRIFGETLPLRDGGRQLDTEASDIHTVCRSNCQQDGKDTFDASERGEGKLQSEVAQQIMVKKMIIRASGHRVSSELSTFKWFLAFLWVSLDDPFKTNKLTKTWKEMKLRVWELKDLMRMSTWFQFSSD